MSSRLEGARHGVSRRRECDVAILDVCRGPNAALGPRTVCATADLVSLTTDLDGAAVEEERTRGVAKEVAHGDHGRGRGSVARCDHRIRGRHERVAKMQTEQHAVA